MITRVDLDYFKCFDVLRLPLAPLTLLSGGNASGKSSVLQALALLHQTMREHEWSKRLMLNGRTMRMGTVNDVVDKVNGRFGLSIGVVDEDYEYKWEFLNKERTEMSMALDCFKVDGDAIADSLDLANTSFSLRYLMPPRGTTESRALQRRLRDLTYITAERVGPREIYPLEDRQVATVVGTAGEYAGSVLHQGRDELVLDELVVEGTPPTRIHQVTTRMRSFFPGFRLEVEKIEKTNSVRLGIRTSDDTDYHRPFHVGFGLTQVLPIVIAALSATRGDLLLIENPEVHLHPAGQALMGQFLAEIANAGVQVIVETHSDHVLNGVRRSVKSGKIPHDQVAIHFFRPRPSEGAQVVTPQLDAAGNIDTWPEGFFDQFDKDSSYFAGWGE